MRERLIELLINAPECDKVDENGFCTCEYSNDIAKCEKYRMSRVADYLLAERVIVPPIWVGSTVYYIYDILGEWRIQEMRVTSCTFDEQGLCSLRAKSLNGNQDLPFVRHHPYYNFDVLRFTREEAEQALAERNRQ